MRNIKDSSFLIAFCFLNLFFLVLSRNYFLSFRESSEAFSLNRLSKKDMKGWKDELEKKAALGLWLEFEKIRNQKVAFLIEKKIHTPLMDAVYFFPEVLPERSFERTFAFSDLKPLIQALRQACLEGHELAIQKAYDKLQSRVYTYERGVSTESQALTKEGQLFLKIYSTLKKKCAAPFRE